jgi:hypothetical protein
MYDFVIADSDVKYHNPDPVNSKDQMLSDARKIADARIPALRSPTYVLNFDDELSQRLLSIASYTGATAFHSHVTW